MKNHVLLSIAVLFSINSFAQQSQNKATDKKKENTTITSDTIHVKEVVVGYHVEESINMKFGGRKTSYNVPSTDLIEKNDLGPGNTRVVKPKYIKVKEKEQMKPIAKSDTAPIVATKTVIKPVKVTTSLPDGKLQYAKIKIIENYERVLERGYKTEEMLIAVGNYHYFENDLPNAAKWYAQLFEFCPDELEAVYYYRYAKSLESIGQTKKAGEMMAMYQIKKM